MESTLRANNAKCIIWVNNFSFSDYENQSAGTIIRIEIKYNMDDFVLIDKARKVLGLKDYATLDDIREVYRELSLKYHPDRCKGKKKKECEEFFKEITNAYQVVISYCERYLYSFKEKDVKRGSMSSQQYEHLKQFYDGWWGNLDL
ncbi:MAG: DnaJ domain-containing protein [Candidatus Omnitrophica bacterium]|nr:DnaJ domain-containing protein [Candidatus Omnitrophota bacterium]